MPVKKKTSAYSLKGVAFSYGSHDVLHGVTVEIPEGDYLGIVGPNGGGKTTLLKILLGILTPTKGEIKLFGETLKSSNERPHIGYVPQRASSLGESFPGTVEEIVSSGRTALHSFWSSFKAADRRAITQAVEVTGIEHLLKRRIGTLSGGERQRVLIARALAAEPKVLILDEPTSAVDVKAQEQVYEFLHELRKKLKLTIILVSHDLDVVSHEVDQILCLNGHMVCHGPAAETMHHARMIHAHE